MSPARRKNGFALLIVVLLLGLMGMGFAVWSAQTRELVIQTKRQTTQAQLDNTIASAAQWAKINRTTLKKTPLGQITRLDLAQVQIPGLECQYRVTYRDSRKTEIEITAVGSFHFHSVKKTVRLTF